MTLSDDERFESLRDAVASLLAADRRRRGREQQRRAGTMGPAHLRALFFLTKQPEATAGTLAREAGLNPASVTAMLDQLEGRGLVERRRDTQDRRQCWISLTDTGRKEVEEQERRTRAKMEANFADITPKEVAAAVKVMNRVADIVESMGRTAESEPA